MYSKMYNRTDMNNNLKELSKELWDFLKKCYSTDKIIYDQIRNEELSNKNILIEFEENYKNVLNEDNLDNVLSILKAKKME